MVKVIGVKFKTSGRIYYFDPLDLDFHAGDGVIVETSRGIEFGDVACDPKEVEETEIVAPLKPVVRIATEEDWRMRDEYASKEPEAFALCEQKILEHNLDMKLVDAEYIFNGSKVVFYFTADERVDFRELVKDLAYSLRTRIELRQIGVRDEAKMLGGLGPCGRSVCCNAFLDDFRPVSIKMAKEQNLSLSPTKISGLCGRLMCCLQYEQNVYDSMKKVMPRVGKEINTIDGVGIVVENNAITEKTKVKLTMEDGTIDVREYPYTHLGPVGEPLPKAALDAKESGPSDTLARPVRSDNASRKPQRPENRTAKQEPEKPGQGPKEKQDPKQEQKDGKNPKPQGKPKDRNNTPTPSDQNRNNPKKDKSQTNARQQNPAGGGAKDPNRSTDKKAESAGQNNEHPERKAETPAKKNKRRRNRGRKNRPNRPQGAPDQG